MLCHDVASSRCTRDLNFLAHSIPFPGPPRMPIQQRFSKSPFLHHHHPHSSFPHPPAQPRRDLLQKGDTQNPAPPKRRGQKKPSERKLLCKQGDNTYSVCLTMTMTHSEKSNINQMSAWPYRQECRDHGPSKKNLSHWGSLLLGKVCKYKLLWTECNAS